MPKQKTLKFPEFSFKFSQFSLIMNNNTQIYYSIFLLKSLWWKLFELNFEWKNATFKENFPKWENFGENGKVWWKAVKSYFQWGKFPKQMFVCEGAEAAVWEVKFSISHSAGQAPPEKRTLHPNAVQRKVSCAFEVFRNAVKRAFFVFCKYNSNNNAYTICCRNVEFSGKLSKKVLKIGKMCKTI